MARIRFKLVGVLVTLIMLGVAVSPAYARMGMNPPPSDGGTGSSQVVLDQLSGLIQKFNAEHTNLATSFSDEFGNMIYVVVKTDAVSGRSMMGMTMGSSSQKYGLMIDEYGNVTVASLTGVSRRGCCAPGVTIKTTEGDVTALSGYLMAKPENYITRDDLEYFINPISSPIKNTLLGNMGLIDDIFWWILDEYL